MHDRIGYHNYTALLKIFPKGRKKLIIFWQYCPHIMPEFHLYMQYICFHKPPLVSCCNKGMIKTDISVCNSSFCWQGWLVYGHFTYLHQQLDDRATIMGWYINFNNKQGCHQYIRDWDMLIWYRICTYNISYKIYTLYTIKYTYRSGHGTAAVLLPGFAINW